MSASVEPAPGSLPHQPHDGECSTRRNALLRLVAQIDECANPRLRRALADRLLHLMGTGVTLELPRDEALRHSSQQALRRANPATPEFFLALYSVRDWVRSTHA